MGFLGRVGASLAGNAVAKWALGLSAAAIVAAVVAFGAFMFMKGGLAADAKWLASVLKWEREQQATNKEFDTRTIKHNGTFNEQLQEIESKWRANPSQ